VKKLHRISKDSSFVGCLNSERVDTYTATGAGVMVIVDGCVEVTVKFWVRVDARGVTNIVLFSVKVDASNVIVLFCVVTVVRSWVVVVITVPLEVMVTGRSTVVGVKIVEIWVTVTFTV
jgi:hypothetical protein